MIANIISAIPHGFDGCLVEVETDINRGLPAFNIVGMANKTINEAKERVRSAIVNSSLSFPDKKVTVNLAPADLSKDGSHLDLPIALAILAASGQLTKQDTAKRLFIGELSLNGELRPVKGIINIIEAAKRHNIQEVIIPAQNFYQAQLIPDIKICGVSTLMDLFLYLKKQKQIQQPTINRDTHRLQSNLANTPLLDHIYGQKLAKRALAIAVAGHHNLLISGPPGSGKTMLAKTSVSLLPDLSINEQIELTKIYSIAGLATNEIIDARPFRSPHHTASLTSIIGGGPRALPGEISLAHKGVLFLDELPEFSRQTLEALRQPLEDRHVSISRTQQKATYPADFMLIATMNPCPCGYFGDPTHACSCSESQIQNYQKKISGPLLDRFDMFLSVEKVKNSDLLKKFSSSNREHNNVKNNIIDANTRQRQRYHQSNRFNSALSSCEVSKHLRLQPTAEHFLQNASKHLSLSARAYFKTIKVAQTIADLDQSEVINEQHISEALSFRKRP